MSKVSCQIKKKNSSSAYGLLSKQLERKVRHILSKSFSHTLNQKKSPIQKKEEIEAAQWIISWRQSIYAYLVHIKKELKTMEKLALKSISQHSQKKIDLSIHHQFAQLKSTLSLLIDGEAEAEQPPEASFNNVALFLGEIPEQSHCFSFTTVKELPTINLSTRYIDFNARLSSQKGGFALKEAALNYLYKHVDQKEEKEKFFTAVFAKKMWGVGKNNIFDPIYGNLSTLKNSKRILEQLQKSIQYINQLIRREGTYIQLMQKEMRTRRKKPELLLQEKE